MTTRMVRSPRRRTGESGEDHADLEGLAQADSVGDRIRGRMCCGSETPRDDSPAGRPGRRRACNESATARFWSPYGTRVLRISASARPQRHGWRIPSATNSLPSGAGPRWCPGSSRKRPSSPRPTRTEPRTRTSQPSAPCSAEVTSHSSSRMTTMEPGATLRSDVESIRPFLFFWVVCFGLFFPDHVWGHSIPFVSLSPLGCVGVLHPRGQGQLSSAYNQAGVKYAKNGDSGDLHEARVRFELQRRFAKGLSTICLGGHRVPLSPSTSRSLDGPKEPVSTLCCCRIRRIGRQRCISIQSPDWTTTVGSVTWRGCRLTTPRNQRLGRTLGSRRTRGHSA